MARAGRRRSERSVGARVGGRGGARKTAEAAIAARELAQCRGEGRLVEVGPVGIDEYELGISAFPQQEVAQPAFTARADQQVDGRVSLAVRGLCKRSLEVLQRAVGAREGGRARDR